VKGNVMTTLKRITIKGFKSIRDMSLELRPLNVLIGVNGSGKSNLVSFFKMINEMMGGRLQEHIATGGRAHSLLHFGPKVTPQMEAALEFDANNGTDTYYVRLFHAAGDTLVFAEESLKFVPHGWVGERAPLNLGAGHQETRVQDEADKGEPTARVFRRLLNYCRVFHFHDTSATARVRQYCYVGDDRWLMPDAGNLAAILYRLRNKATSPAYRRILSSVRRIAPFFEDFELAPTGVGDKDIILNWRQKGSDQVFGPHQLSDGTLRAMALVTLLQQPADDLPDLIVVDEPELGLHPAAKTLIAGLFKKASHHCRVIVATQSAALLDAFDAEDVVVVERDTKESKFWRQDSTRLQEWLEEYSMGQLWEKNVLGGGPFS
jgi:predicted ATPase